MDPYRSSGGDACPQCASPLDMASGGPAPCANGCGEWLPMAYIATVFDIAELDRESPHHEQAESQAYQPPPCPSCERPLVRAWLKAAPVRLCAEHGVWIAAASHDRFTAQLAAPMARHQRMLALAALLAAADEGSRREVARRVIVVEDRLAVLGAELAALRLELGVARKR